MIECHNCHHANVDDASVCARCGFTLDWVPKPKPKPEPAPEPTEVVVALEPKALSVAAGARATTRLAAVPPALATAEWAVVGEAGAFAHVKRASGAVVVEVEPEATEPPRTLSLRLVAVESAVPARAEGTITITGAAGPSRDQPPNGSAWTASRIALVIAGVLLLLLVIRGVYVLATRHAVEITARSGVCLHTEPNVLESTRIPLPGGQCEGPENGETVHVRCEEPGLGVYRLHGGFWPGGDERWMTTSPRLVRPSSDIPQC